MSELLTIKQLSVQLQHKTILSNINLALCGGEILGLVGPSGCGKTTLLNTLAGFIAQSEGELILGNREAGDTPIHITPDFVIPPEQRNIGMIFQDYALFPHLTVEENICFGLENISKEERKARLTDLLALLKLTSLEKRFPHQLSGGQQQRVAIARALAPQPKLLLLDEPFSNIDARLRNELMLEMRNLLKQLNITAIFVTHNKDEVFTFADKIAVMNQGTLLQTGSPRDVCQSPASWQVADFLQLGSWIPVRKSGKAYTSAIGDVYARQTQDDLTLNNKPLQLLLKPHHIELSNTNIANVKVEHISVTEQGFHYLLCSLNESELSFKQLSFYSDALLMIGEEIAISVKEHDVAVYAVTV